MPCGDLPLSGKIVLVTGGGSGINLSFAKLAVQNEARGVIIADLRLNDDSKSFVDSNVGQVIFTECNVTKRKDLENLIKVSVDKFGDVPDVFIAGAGVFTPTWSNWWDDTEDDRYAELDINTTGPLKLSRIAVRSLVAKGKKGVVLIVASLAGYMGTFACPNYCASKHAVIGFVRSMEALDHLENIKIVAVAPGLVSTPLWTNRPDLQKQFGYDENYAVSPEFVAENMLKLVTDGQYGGSTCLEVSKGSVRTLGVWNIDPPPGMGTAVPHEALGLNYAPMKIILNKDRQHKF